MPTELSLNRKSKDSVFVRFFQDKNNILQFYKELHPEMTDISVDDIDIQTLDSVIVNTIYNDLGFFVKGKYVLLVEAQSTWNPNIALRMLFYLTETLRRHLDNTDQSEHYCKKVSLPTPELYVLYSGPGEKPATVSLSEEFFGGTPNIELKVNVLSKVDDTLSGQYIGFCKVFDEQRKLGNNSLESAKETFKLCIEKGYLTDFMKEHQKEVVDMMSELFDEAYLRARYDAAVRREQFDAGKLEGIREGMREGMREGKLEGMREGKLEGMREGKLEGMREGKLEGMREGMREGKLEVVRRMIKQQMSFELISGCVQLPLEEIEEIARTLN